MSRQFIMFLKNKRTLWGLSGFTALTLIVSAIFLPSQIQKKLFAPPNSVRIGPHKKYIFNHSPLVHSTLKLSGPLSVSFSTLDNEPIEPNKAFTLILKIKTSVPIANAKIQWQIPEGVQHINGHLDENIDLSQGEYQIQADFMVSENKNFQIHALVSTNSDHLSFAQAAQFNTYVYRELQNKLSHLKATNKKYLESKNKFKIFE